MLDRRDFIYGVSMVIVGGMLCGCHREYKEDYDMDERFTFIDVPPTDENIRIYSEVLDYYDNDVVPYEGYEPPCSRREAASAFEGMGEWIHVDGAELISSDDDITVTLDWLPDGSQVSLLNNSNPWSSEFGVVKNGPHKLGLTRKLWVNLGLDNGTDNLWLKVERYGE